MSKPETIKKLALNTETLHSLTPENLESALGGLGDIHATQSCCLFNSCVGKPQPPFGGGK
jgi:hypothetical protein